MKPFLLRVLLAVMVAGWAAPQVLAASPGAVSVALTGVTDGQTVGGVLKLSVIAAAPQPVAAVEYWLDAERLAKVVLAPYTFEWDATTAAPGAHTLAARVTDRAGNTGEAQVQVHIVPPIDLMVSAPRDVVRPGEVLQLNINITAIHAVAQIDLIVDNRVLSSDRAQPFELALDTRALPLGAHTVTVRATDVTGQQARASLPLRLEAPPADYTWLRVLIVLGLMATAIAAGFAVWRTVDIVRRSYQRVCRLELRNLGNVPARYEVLADDPAGTLKFRLWLNGSAVPQEPAAKPALRSASAPTAAPSSVATAREKGSLLTNIAYSVGNLLPGSAGRQVTNWASTARNAEYTAQRVEYTGQQVRDLGGGSAATAPETAAATLSLTPGAWYTPFLQPGDVVALNLVVDPGRPTQTQHYTFRVSSRAVEPFTDAVITETAQLQVTGVSLWKYYLPFFIIAGLTITIIVIIALLLANSGLLG